MERDNLWWREILGKYDEEKFLEDWKSQITLLPADGFTPTNWFKILYKELPYKAKDSSAEPQYFLNNVSYKKTHVEIRRTVLVSKMVFRILIVLFLVTSSTSGSSSNDDSQDIPISSNTEGNVFIYVNLQV